MKIARLSGTGWMRGRVPVSSSTSSCHRYAAVLRHLPEGVSLPFPEVYRILGAMNENRFVAELAKDPRYTEIERERTLRIDLDGGHYVEGHCDIYCLEDGQPVIFELKSANSKRTLATCIKKGQPKSDNLAQLVAYLCAAGLSKGYLVYSFYPDNVTLAIERKFTVTLADDGAVMLDGVASPYTVQQMLDHLLMSAHVYATNELPERPVNWDVKYKSVCSFCPWHTVCNSSSIGKARSIVEFATECVNLLKEKSNG